PASMIDKGDRQIFSHHAAQHRTENAQARVRQDLGPERIIGVLDVAQLGPAPFGHYGRRKGLAANDITPFRGGIPELWFRRDVVMPRLGRVRSLSKEFPAQIALGGGDRRFNGVRGYRLWPYSGGDH